MRVSMMINLQEFVGCYATKGLDFSKGASGSTSLVVALQTNSIWSLSLKGPNSGAFTSTPIAIFADGKLVFEGNFAT